jgi:hypothetical protein
LQTKARYKDRANQCEIGDKREQGSRLGTMATGKEAGMSHGNSLFGYAGVVARRYCVELAAAVEKGDKGSLKRRGGR